MKVYFEMSVFWANQFLSAIAPARVFDTGVPSFAILMLGPSILSHDMLEFPYLEHRLESFFWVQYSDNV